MKRPLLLLAMLLLSPAVPATTYHVNSARTGAGDGVGNSCLSDTNNVACLTIQGGINKAVAAGACGHTVVVYAGTYSGAVNIPDVNCTDGNRLIVQRDPLAATASVIVAGVVTIGTPAAQPRGGITIKDLKLAATSRPMLDIRGECTVSNNQCGGSTANTIKNLTLDGLVVSNFPATGGDYLMGFHRGSTGEDVCSRLTNNNILLQNLDITNLGGANPTPIDVFLNCSGGFTWKTSRFDNNFNVVGRILGGSSTLGVTVQYNTFKEGACRATPTDGDGCFQWYNVTGTIEWNVFDRIGGRDNNDSPLVGMRESPCDDPGRATQLTFRHNTAISGNAGVGADEAISVYLRCGNTTPNNIMIIEDNIFEQYGNGSDCRGAAITFRGTECPDVPPSLMRNNLFYNNQCFGAGCTGTAPGGDIKSHDGTSGCGASSCWTLGTYGVGDIRNVSPINTVTCTAGTLGCANPGPLNEGNDYTPATGSSACLHGTGLSTIGARACFGGAGSAPVPVSDFSLSPSVKSPQTHMVLTWTSPSGTATSYDIRYSKDPIDDNGFQALPLADVRTLSGVSPTPAAPGVQQSIEVLGLKPNTTYYFAMKSGNASGVSTISNIPSRATAKYEGYGFQSEGGGAFGDGGIDHLCRVTSLADSGTGTLRECLFNSRTTACTRPLTVVFAVGGTITLASDILLDMGFTTSGGANTNDCRITVDGSTAPSPGITIGKQSCGAGPFPTCMSMPSFACIQDGEFKIGGNTSVVTDDVIIDYLRFDGNYQQAWGFCTVESSTTLGLQYSVSDVVVDHCTIVKSTDSGPDIYSSTWAINRVSYSNNLVAWSPHPMLVGGITTGTRDNVSIFRNVIARFAQRGPKIQGASTDVDFRNNIVYDWSSTWVNAGTGEGTRLEVVAGVAPSINLVNNSFITGPGVVNVSTSFGLMYGTFGGFDSQDTPPSGVNASWPAGCSSAVVGGVRCGTCPPQGTTLANSAMGDMYVAGNTFTSPNCDVWDTRDTQLPVTAGAEVTTISAGALGSSLLPDVGTHYRTANETALLAEIGLPVAPSPPVRIKRGKLKHGKIK